MLEFTTNDGLIVKIRPLKLEDALSLQRNLFPTYTLEKFKDLLKKDIAKMEKDDKVRLVTIINGEVIGNLNLSFSRDPWISHTAYLSTLGVNRKFRRRGIGTKMVESGLKIAKEKNIEIVKIEVEAKNIFALELYSKIGFKEYGRLERGFKRKGEYDSQVLLKKDL